MSKDGFIDVKRDGTEGRDKGRKRCRRHDWRFAGTSREARRPGELYYAYAYQRCASCGKRRKYRCDS